MNKRDCSNCKYCDADYIFDEELEDEYPVYTCNKGNDTSLDSECEDFKKYRPRKYKEKDTECDRCEFLHECGLPQNVTTLGDKRQHYACFDIQGCKKYEIKNH